MKRQPKISLEGTFVQNLSFKRKHSDEPILETKIAISPYVNFDEEQDKKYMVMFDGKFENSLFDLSLQFVTIFSTEETIDEEEISIFPMVCVEDGDEMRFEPVETDEEYDMISEVLDTFYYDESE